MTGQVTDSATLSTNSQAPVAGNPMIRAADLRGPLPLNMAVLVLSRARPPCFLSFHAAHGSPHVAFPCAQNVDTLILGHR